MSAQHGWRVCDVTRVHSVQFACEWNTDSEFGITVFQLVVSEETRRRGVGSGMRPSSQAHFLDLSHGSHCPAHFRQTRYEANSSRANQENQPLICLFHCLVGSETVKLADKNTQQMCFVFEVVMFRCLRITSISNLLVLKWAIRGEKRWPHPLRRQEVYATNADCRHMIV